ncbi:MAG: 2-oxoacid:acceptor oxidoreductase subunit alpha [Deltaproteobacteria bacterium]|nr:2-oxoacid:acceptor oxidoreductase subunit alpha [Deltaproteobacteria bacterium]MBI3389513.1 2-oxoacid:acceptor oxidoreductase subunit alpha [Deltaproteobacteria bacterium]
MSPAAPESAAAVAAPKSVEERETVVIRFAGDSGDGMQVTGAQFTTETALAGNDLSTLPDFPAEIRAPAGTLAGVSGFQLHFSSREVFTPGDSPDVLVAMNPAALKVNIEDLKPNGILIVDKETFNEQNLKKAEYPRNPLSDGSLAKFQVYPIDITKLTTNALQDLSLPQRTTVRCKNFFALGLTSWLFHRPIDASISFIEQRFKKTPVLVEANVRALKAGYNFGDTTELFHTSYTVAPAPIAPGKYRNITGNSAAALGFVAAARRAGLPIFLGSYPITPASDILHEMATYKNFDVYTFQAEDEIAGVGAALGAAFGGAIGITTTSGPGMCLKAETVNLAVSVELPLVIADIQRGGPSTGLPTKTEQADLLMSLYGRNSESPVPVLAACTPADCFATVFECVRIALKYMTPVVFLSDGYLANGAEPWLLPKASDLPEVPVSFRTDPNGYYPYLRDEQTLSRPWVIPGTPGLEHRIGGIEKEYLTGNVSYAPMNHEQMVRVRARKIAGIAREIPPTEVHGPATGTVLVVGWGSTFGAIAAATKELQVAGHAVSHVHLRHLNPLPPDLGDILRRFERVLIPEINLGQLLKVIRAEYLVDAIGLNKIQGQPFKVHEIVGRIQRLLEA